MLAFGALVASSGRVHARQSIELLYRNLVSAQGSEKGVKSFVKPYETQAKVGMEPETEEAEFLRAFGGGF